MSESSIFTGWSRWRGAATRKARDLGSHHVAFFISAVMAISYIDRQALSVAIGEIQRDFPLSNVNFSQLQSAFLAGYAITYVLGGRMMDVLGPRRGFIIIVTGWSLAFMSQGLAAGFAWLAVSRFLLGAGEGGAFPGASKAIADEYSAEQRSVAMGIIHAGTSAGSVLAPPLIVAMLTLSSWRWMFIAVGALGLVWVVLWWWYANSTTQAVTAPGERPAPDAALPWLKLLSFREVWGLFAAKILYDAAFYFYLFWIPKYLLDARGFSTTSIGYFAWIPYAFHGLGGLTGGYGSAALVRRGVSVVLARKILLGASAVIMPVVLLVTTVPVQGAVAILSIAFFGQAVTSTMVFTLPADLFPKRVVGSVSGLFGLGGTFGGALFGFVAGYVLDGGYGYGPVFAMVASFHIVAFAIILATIRKPAA